MSLNKRPESSGPAHLYYNEQVSKQYSYNSRTIQIQTEMTERALQLLNLDEETGPKLILDIGSGSGLSGDILTEHGHIWVGVDVSPSMLDICVDRETQGDLIQRDIGTGLPFRMGAFDGVIGISCIQWLCQSDKKIHNPITRIRRFYQSLAKCMAPGARAVFQFYPQNKDQTDLLVREALRCSLAGNLIIDNQHSRKNRKMYLVLTAGAPGTKLKIGDPRVPNSTSAPGFQEDDQFEYFKIGKKIDLKKKRPTFKSRAWILEKKAHQRLQNKKVRKDTKYSGRKRKPRF